MLALIAGLSSGAFVSLLAWGFNKLAYEAIHLRAAHRGTTVIINQSALFMCILSVWACERDRQEIQHKLQECLMAEKPDAAIDFCVQQIQNLKNIKITSRNIKELTVYVREHLDFLEKTLSTYDGSFMHYAYCGYLLSQHSELHKILLIFESPVIPTRKKSQNKQSKASTITKTLIIKKAFGVYLDKLEKFLEEARKKLQKEPPNAQDS